MFVRTVALAILGVVLAPGAARAQYSAGSIRFELRGLRHSAVAIAKKNYFRRNRGCRVVPIRASRRAFFQHAVAHAHRVLTDKRFGRHVRWWRASVDNPTSADGLVRKLTRTPLTIYVTAFRRDHKHPCRTRFADGHTNAFVPDVKQGAVSHSRLLFLAQAYVDEQYYAPDPQKGVRNLARTLIHEALHIMGYSHARRILFSARYNRSVPVYLGCVVMNWDRSNRWLQRYCHKATGLRKRRSPYRWMCYTNRSLRQHVGRKVDVTVAPNPKHDRGNRRPATLVRVHEDDTVTVRWQQPPRNERVGKCRLVM